jgi:hypothetical protein
MFFSLVALQAQRALCEEIAKLARNMPRNRVVSLEVETVRVVKFSRKSALWARKLATKVCIALFS